ncbi:MAG: MBL fold metallo-hydrolase [Proteobacteria bacterium]|nr:MBL fold metallo-hydrolase [Pseudomonadota bacterium]
MDSEEIDVLRKGDENGNHMIIRITLPSGTEIYGFATENISSEEWHLGPTWNYLVMAEKPLLWDTGGRGMGPRLLEMIEGAGFRGGDIEAVILSHGHEDHDGGLFGFTSLTGARIIAHEIYPCLSRAAPSMAPVDWKRAFPASCWHCALPQSFSQKTCLDYHREKMGLEIEGVSDPRHSLGSGLILAHVPGHAPDAVTLLVGDEAMLVGDTILPDITPVPTQEGFFRLTKTMIPDRYVEAQELYGLRAYLRSLRRLAGMGKNQREVMVLPSHRLFFEGEWRFIDLQARVQELIKHHIDRCSDILRILKDGPLSAEEIAEEHFEPRLLKGYGIYLAVNEVLSHCELLENCKDVVFEGDGKISWTGKTQFESLIRGLN